ncbi:hypothetical protein [Legionella maioricensis]|uniref:Transmembrane protein n=1 Tax=Legionella maioricensis TaxID=2896528 RepID=A0A9X2CXJ0_9GAMM|nr:hypothetical protein [Legionella maioricensis]MCL9682674.1 hypothetical protein [Legionella maioricensis]MCL9687279.1 hypothetical protein [Legionella maioricensis]
MSGFELPQVMSTLDAAAVRATATAREYVSSSPGFFTPYRSAGDFAKTVAAPVVCPISFAVITGLLGVASGIAAAICITSFAAAGIAAAAGNQDARNSALSVGVICGFAAVAAPLLAAAFALCIVASLIMTAAALVTRTGATVVNGVANGVKALSQCCHSEENHHDNEMTTSHSLA